MFALNKRLHLVSYSSRLNPKLMYDDEVWLKFILCSFLMNKLLLFFLLCKFLNWRREKNPSGYLLFLKKKKKEEKRENKFEELILRNNVNQKRKTRKKRLLDLLFEWSFGSIHFWPCFYTHTSSSIFDKAMYWMKKKKENEEFMLSFESQHQTK